MKYTIKVTDNSYNPPIVFKFDPYNLDTHIFNSRKFAERDIKWFII